MSNASAPVSPRATPAMPAAPGAQHPPATHAEPPGRLQSLDVYRGLIMVALAFHGFGLAATARNHLKTDPDSTFWQAILRQFEHVEWVGCSFWDLIQPSFMFMVGVSMAYSYLNRQAAGHSWWRMFAHANRRALILIFLGIFLTSNNARSTNWSLTNVLTQIGLGYPFLFLMWGRSVRTHAMVAGSLLVVTWALYSFYPHAGVSLDKGAPQAGVPSAWAEKHLAGIAPAWHKNANVGHAVDRVVLNAFPRREAFTFNVGGYPTINFIPSLATMLFGLMCGELLRSARVPRRKLIVLVAAGVAGLAAGWLLHAIGVPLVKRIWTPSWALYSTGWCCLILAGLYAVVDLRQWRAWSFPLVVVGMNSIAIYCMGMLLRPWTAKTLQTHLGEDVFSFLGPAYVPFVQSLLVGGVFWLVCWWMYRRRVFLRV